MAYPLWPTLNILEPDTTFFPEKIPIHVFVVNTGVNNRYLLTKKLDPMYFLIDLKHYLRFSPVPKC